MNEWKVDICKLEIICQCKWINEHSKNSVTGLFIICNKL